jgi:DNA-binding GntR family transcriptional regulator
MKNLGALHENLDHKVYLALKQMITERILPPGHKIPQEKIAGELGISRTPLVNALKYLEKENLVIAHPRRGFFVRLFTDGEMIQIFELREVLEGLAARRAAAVITALEAERLRRFFRKFPTDRTIDDAAAYAQEDREFHNHIARLGSHEFLQSVLEVFNIISFSYQFSSAHGLARDPEETIHEHLAIIEALVSKDPQASERMMRAHFQNSIAVIRNRIARRG